MKKITLAVAAMLTAVAANAQFTVTTENNTTQEIQGNVTFSTNAEGSAWSVGDTYNPDLDLSNIKSITLAEPKPAAKVGDYLYSDGSYSSTLDADKKVIGIVFWSGDATVDDPALRADHPECTHGLAVSLIESRCEWQEYYEDISETVGDWIAENTDYASIDSGYGLNTPMNKMMGYNNTLGINAYNDEFIWDYEVIVASRVSFIMDDSYPAPANTSGWYIPSAKEVSLLISGPYDGDIDDIGYLDTPLVENLATVNAKIATVANATVIDGVYWTSNEESERQVFTLKTSNALLMETSKGGSNAIRPIIAF